MSDWHAIVVDGGAHAVRGFVSGFAGDRGVDPARVLLADDVGVEPESLGERLLHLLRLEHHHLVLAPDDLADALVAALARAGREAGLALRERHRIARTHFRCSAETFSRDVAHDVHVLLASPPAGVTIADLDERAETHADEKGLAMRAPGHAYAYRAHGRVVGKLEGVLAVRRALERIECVVLEPVQLEVAT
jgi:hypothetical protein